MTTRLFHISDVHFGVEDRTALDAFAQAVAEQRPDAVICTGDLTQRAKHSEYAAARQWFASLGVPVVLEVGNHDMPYYNPWERFTDPFRRYDRLNADVGSELASDDVVLVRLRTTVRAQRRFPWSDGVITAGALTETLAALAALKDDPRTIIVIGHHPLLGPEGSQHNPTIGGDCADCGGGGACDPVGPRPRPVRSAPPSRRGRDDADDRDRHALNPAAPRYAGKLARADLRTRRRDRHPPALAQCRVRRASVTLLSYALTFSL